MIQIKCKRENFKDSKYSEKLSFVICIVFSEILTGRYEDDFEEDISEDSDSYSSDSFEGESEEEEYSDTCDASYKETIASADSMESFVRVRGRGQMEKRRSGSKKSQRDENDSQLMLSVKDVKVSKLEAKNYVS